jgi:hypothetical protein
MNVHHHCADLRWALWHQYRSKTAARQDREERIVNRNTDTAKKRKPAGHGNARHGKRRRGSALPVVILVALIALLATLLVVILLSRGDEARPAASAVQTPGEGEASLAVLPEASVMGYR